MPPSARQLRREPREPGELPEEAEEEEEAAEEEGEQGEEEAAAAAEEEDTESQLPPPLAPHRRTWTRCSAIGPPKQKTTTR